MRPKERLATVFEVGGELREEDLKTSRALFTRLDKNKDGKLVPGEIPPSLVFSCSGAWGVGPARCS